MVLNRPVLAPMVSKFRDTSNDLFPMLGSSWVLQWSGPLVRVLLGSSFAILGSDTV